MESRSFYSRLPRYQKSVNELLGQPELFTQIPQDWHIIVTDIKDSTSAVSSGLSEIVNLVATGSIVAALNIASKLKIDIPFFFGGDGATFLVPPFILNEIMLSLRLHQSNIKKEFNIDLRVGNMPVSAVCQNNYKLKIAKVSMNALLSIPIVIGDGLQFAEKMIKSEDLIEFPENDTKGQLNLEGMQCRWNKIPPPKNTDEVVCLLINSQEESNQANVYKRILDEADTIYGSHNSRNPISLPRLKLNVGFQNIKTELSIRRPGFGMIEWIGSWIYSVVGKYIYLPSRQGQNYLNELIQLSDIFVLDGRINMIISGTSYQRKQLTTYLDDLEQSGEILYGIHISEESIISCYVSNRHSQHIHFVNGSDGGYTKAATVLKEKLRLRV